MKISVKKIFVLGLIIFLLIQFYQPARNLDYGQVCQLISIYAVPSDVESILRTSCYDCHSNTEYPWYSYIQPARMILDNHGRKRKLEFQYVWRLFSTQAGNKLERIVKQIKSDEMPLASYSLGCIKCHTAKRIKAIDYLDGKHRDSMSTGF
jgi:hypothetical protein